MKDNLSETIERDKPASAEIDTITGIVLETTYCYPPAKGKDSDVLKEYIIKLASGYILKERTDKGYCIGDRLVILEYKSGYFEVMKAKNLPPPQIDFCEMRGY
jgi:hypothetical protein